MKLFYFISIFFITSISVAQPDTLFFNEGWKLCVKGKASFYRIAEPQPQGGYLIKDMFLKTNTPQMIAFSATIEPTLMDGKCTFYYSNGRKKSEGRYANNYKTGNWTNWLENGKDSTFEECGIPQKKTIVFTPQEITAQQKAQDSILKYKIARVEALDELGSSYEDDKAGFTFTIRAKFATFFIIEDVYFLTYTLGTEFGYNKHSLGLDYTWFRWRYETDNSNDVGMYSQYELRTYLHVDYKYTFVEFDRADVNLYFNSYCKIGNYSMWYDKYNDYDFGTRDMTFLESKTKGIFREPGLGLGFRKYATDAKFGLDCSTNLGYQFTNYNEKKYISATETDFRDGVRNQKFVFDMRINLIYNFGR